MCPCPALSEGGAGRPTTATAEEEATIVVREAPSAARAVALFFLLDAHVVSYTVLYGVERVIYKHAFPGELQFTAAIPKAFTCINVGSIMTDHLLFSLSLSLSLSLSFSLCCYGWNPRPLHMPDKGSTLSSPALLIPSRL
jgi:hypothetical protein